MSQETYACENERVPGGARDYIQVGSQPPVHKSGAFTVHVVGCHGFTTVLLRQPLLFWRRPETYCHGEGKRNYPIFSSSKFIVSKFSYKLYSNIVSKFRNVSNIHYYSHSQESLKRILERIHD